ncbi:MAG: hypothetical protein LBK95_03020 [Bifidobacteriaceae bacterium]|nr:hypothetical protein [Bifidobacteriaceae bacterium]
MSQTNHNPVSRIRRCSVWAAFTGTVAACALVVSGAGAAGAVTPPTHEDDYQEIAKAVGSAAPELQVVKAADTNDGSLVASTDSSSVSLPVGDGEAIRVEGNDGAEAFGIGLPEGTDVLGAGIASDGTVVYTTDTDAQIAVQVHDSGVRVLVVIESYDGPTRFDYPITLSEDGAAVLNPDGNVVVVSPDGEPVAFAEAPWAVDALGQEVPTHFELSDKGWVRVGDTVAGCFL